MIGDLNFGAILHANRCERVLSNELRISLIFTLAIYPDRTALAHEAKGPKLQCRPAGQERGNISKTKMLMVSLTYRPIVKIATPLSRPFRKYSLHLKGERFPPSPGGH